MKQWNKNAELKPFLILWSSQMVSALGSAMTSFALMIWAYKQQGTASSISLLAVCTYLPAILFSFIAGSLADRWNKKKIMLICDTIAAIASMTVFLLISTDQLAIWHLYVINTILGFMNAFQIPASTVAITLIAPKEQYVRIGGLQSLSSSLVTILTPALATSLLALSNMQTILLFDLLSFAVAFLSLLCFIPIPHVLKKNDETSTPPLKSCLAGLIFLKKHRPLWNMILFFAFINLLASMAGNSIMPAMILARTGNNEITLGMICSGIGIGSILGSILVTLSKPYRNKTGVIFISCALSFLLCEILWGVGRNVWIWVFASIAGNLPLPFLNANLSAIMRTKVPVEMQGRVFSARDTLQYFTIPIGYLLGGFLADRIFEPFMQIASPLQRFLGSLVGTGKGSGMAVIFLLTGMIGFFTCIFRFKKREYECLNDSSFFE